MAMLRRVVECRVCGGAAALAARSSFTCSSRKLLCPPATNNSTDASSSSSNPFSSRKRIDLCFKRASICDLNGRSYLTWNGEKWKSSSSASNSSSSSSVSSSSVSSSSGSNSSGSDSSGGSTRGRKGESCSRDSETYSYSNAVCDGHGLKRKRRCCEQISPSHFSFFFSFPSPGGSNGSCCFVTFTRSFTARAAPAPSATTAAAADVATSLSSSSSSVHASPSSCSAKTVSSSLPASTTTKHLLSVHPRGRQLDVAGVPLFGSASSADIEAYIHQKVQKEKNLNHLQQSLSSLHRFMFPRPTSSQVQGFFNSISEVCYALLKISLHKTLVISYECIQNNAETSDWPAMAVELNGLRFANPIGLAAGFDKNAEAVLPLLRMGFGFVEVGSVTPQPQKGNPRPRIFRLFADRAIINRCGFNSKGADYVEQKLRDISAKRWTSPLTSAGVVGVNIGKNKTGNAVEDLQRGIQQLAQYADFLVINLSSPNTPGLRALQQKQELATLIDAAQQQLHAVEQQHAEEEKKKKKKKKKNEAAAAAAVAVTVARRAAQVQERKQEEEDEEKRFGKHQQREGFTSKEETSVAAAAEEEEDGVDLSQPGAEDPAFQQDMYRTQRKQRPLLFIKIAVNK